MELSCRSERIVVGRGFVLNSDLLARALPPKCDFVGIVVDARVTDLAARLCSLLQNDQRRVSVFVLPEGESSKSRSSKSEIEDWLLREGAGKNSVLVACGGGVVGDLTGFVASSFYRGVPVVQIPTSLLAMVDSSIGGKTAIDVWAGKNLIGAFHHPLLVAIDVELLRTLPLKQLMNGMAEVIKVAVALDAAFFSYLERADIAKLVAARDEETLLYIVKRSAELKAGIVEGDERDAGRRNILNLGHTVGHAIEHLFSWLHGEAVASGMVVEAYAALELGILKTPAVIERLRRVLKLYQLPFAAPFGDLTPEKVDKLLDLCRADKKASARGEIRCVLLSGVGSVGPGITYSVPERLMRLLLSPACAVSPPERVAPTREVAVRVPGSKSVSNRVLLLAALGRGETCISGLLHAADTYVMLEALSVLGVRWRWNDEGSQLLVVGSAGMLRSSPGASIFLDNAGTASRFLVAAALWLKEGDAVELRGSARLHERPVRPLVEALQRAGARIEYVKSEGYFPLLVHGRDGVMHEQNSSITMDASLSSQFVSSALMGGARRGLELVLTGKLVSQPYVVMTAALMRRFGVNVVAAANGARFSVPASECYVNPPSIDVEADASSATYPLAFAALSPGLTVTVSNLGSSSLQGDASFALLLERIGCKVQQTAETTTVTGPARLTAIPELNMADQTDAFLTMAVVAACCEPGQTTRIVGIANQRVKECDRIAAVAEGLRKCGVRAEELEDGIAVTAGFASNVSERKLIRCFKDHRVAMSFAVLGLRVSGVVLLDKGCVEKTFPSFWNMIASAEFGMRVDAAPEREKEEELVDNRHVVLIGMRGAGKTTLGAELARALGRRFVDADRELEARNDGLALPELVKKVGMDEFRRREAVLLEELLQQHSLLVVACGGGVVETELGQKVLRAAGNAVVVHVRRDVSELMAFLANDAARVPLAEPMQNVWARREPLYEALARREVFWSSVFPPCLRQLERTVRAVLEPQLLPSPCRIGRWTSMVCLTLPSYVHETEELEIHGDALELRADLLRGVAEAKGDETEGAIAGLLRLELAAVRRLGGGRPVVFTLRSASEGGQFCGTQLFYERSLRVAARLGFDALDVECVRMTETLRLQLEEERNSVALLVSEHHMDQAVSHGLLASMASRCLAACSPRFRHAVTVKLVCGALPDDAVRSADVVRGFVQGWDQIPQLLCVLSGERGVLSRVLAPRLSPCRVERAPPAAPGQVGAAKLRSLQSDLGVLSVAKLQLFGTPISRSPSPSIHNAAFGVLGVPLAYGLHETGDADELKRVVTSPVFVGGNVTLPLKEAAFALCHRVSLAARVVGAVNVLWRDESSGMLFGDNTDWRGMAELVARASTKRRIGDDLRVLVLGAGGTARAAVLAARAVGAGRVAVYNRSVARAQALAKDLSSKDFTVLVVDRLEGPAPHIVLGCLPGDAAAPPFPDSWRSGNVDVLLESAYRPRVTPTIAALQAKTVIYGEELLLEQAVWGSQIWTARAAPREEMAKAMAAFL